MGRIEEAIAARGAYENPKLSRDGRRLAFFRADTAAGDIWITDLDRKNTTRLTFGAAVDNYPVWSPDGGRIVFASDRLVPGVAP